MGVDALAYPNEELKNIRIAINQLRESLEQEKTESSILLNEIKSTLKESLSKLDVLNTTILNKLPSISDKDLRLLFDTVKDLRYRFRLVPLSITRNDDDYITQIKYEFLDQVITVDYTLDSNNYITDKSVKIEVE